MALNYIYSWIINSGNVSTNDSQNDLFSYLSDLIMVRPDRIIHSDDAVCRNITTFTDLKLNLST